ncbi:zinc-ribbon domain-containing protein [Desulfogranum mediterraneum]|uniref:zinc-ribbon domain-containing protein n=1 Tax=Desulfogranum mediterraneum TaxID=160661 RepID=UPI0012946557
MLVICEECSKKYNIDLAMMKSDQARFSCYECGHIIVVKRPQSQPPEPSEPKPAPHN